MLKSALALAFRISPRVVFDRIKADLQKMVPLNILLGVEIVSIGEGYARARLPFRQETTNHIGSVHATALFGLAEAASGFALAGAFAPVVLDISPVAATATISYLKVAKTETIAEALVKGVPHELRKSLNEAGSVKFDIDVVVKDTFGDTVAHARITWSVRKKSTRRRANGAA